MTPRRRETARGIPRAFQRRPLTKWDGEPMLQDVVCEGGKEKLFSRKKELALKRAQRLSLRIIKTQKWPGIYTYYS